MTFRAYFYKGSRPGFAGVYNWAVRQWERGPYSHCELRFSDGMSASASFADGGVRFKLIEYDLARWDYVELPPELERGARAYFERHQGERYDLVGNAHFLIGFIPHSETRKFCSEACAGALGIKDAWRYGPNAFYPMVLALCHAYNSGRPLK